MSSVGQRADVLLLTELQGSSGLFRTFGYSGSHRIGPVTGIVFIDGDTDHGLRGLAVVVVAAGAIVLAMTLRTPSLRVQAPCGEDRAHVIGGSGLLANEGRAATQRPTRCAGLQQRSEQS